MDVHRAMFWFFFGAIVTFGFTLMAFGVVFLRDAFIGMGDAVRGEFVFSSFLFGMVLLIVGGGLLSSAIAESVRRMWKR